MALLGPFDRPLGLSLRGLGRTSAPRPARNPPPAVALQTTTDIGRLRTSRFLLDVLLGVARPGPDVIARVEVAVHDELLVWMPFLSTTSRTELVAALAESDDAINDVVVAITGQGVAGPSTYLEWRLTGRFVNAGFLNDDLLVEPSGAVVECSGISVFEFSHDWVTRIHCCYDALTLLEQVLLPLAPEG